jgi:hypothetical protein
MTERNLTFLLSEFDRNIKKGNLRTACEFIPEMLRLLESKIDPKEVEPVPERKNVQAFVVATPEKSAEEPSEKPAAKKTGKTAK